MNLSHLVDEFSNPGSLLIHAPYALLVVSMMMNDMGWLRALAITAGLIRIVNRSLVDVDPLIALWETAFVGVNVAQLIVLWYYAKRHRFTDDERRFLETMPASADRRIVRRLLRLGRLEDAEAGATLTVADRPVESLAFITDGLAQVERNGAIVAVCGPGDFVGEMSFATGRPASATVVCARPVRYFSFDQQTLRRTVDRDAEMGRILDACFSRNLALKLSRSGSRETPA